MSEQKFMQKNSSKNRKEKTCRKNIPLKSFAKN